MFDKLVGNERAKETLRRMLKQGRVPGALLFAGEEGLGKRLFALELARALNCRARLAVEELESYLIKTRKRAGEEARLAAHLAAGRPGVALGLNLDTYRARREAMLGVVESLTSNGDRVRLLRAAEEMGDAKNKDEYEPRLDALELLIRDLWLLALRGPDAPLVNYDLRERLARLAVSLPPARASRWLSRIEELRTQLDVNINRRAA